MVSHQIAIAGDGGGLAPVETTSAVKSLMVISAVGWSDEIRRTALELAMAMTTQSVVFADLVKAGIDTSGAPQNGPERSDPLHDKLEQLSLATNALLVRYREAITQEENRTL
jgi:hypothetical protein